MHLIMRKINMDSLCHSLFFICLIGERKIDKRIESEICQSQSEFNLVLTLSSPVKVDLIYPLHQK